jgi:hypothetical protein
LWFLEEKPIRARGSILNTTPDTRELDHRTGDGIEVRLLWNEATNQVSVAVEDRRSGEVLHFAVDGAEARDAFHHPYAYAERELALAA